MLAPSGAINNSDRARASSGLSGFVRELGPQDWLVFTYLVGLNVAVLQGERNEHFASSLLKVFCLLAVQVVGVTLVRTGVLRDGFIQAILYRFVVYGPVQLSYFFFREVLPVVNAGTLDRELLQLDLALFGVEPTLVFDHYITSFTTEWFSFFYFGYFFVLAVHVVPLLFCSRNQRLLGEFALGMLIVFCVGHTVYMLVPGYGPYRYMADAFQNEFPRGLWLDLVMRAVESGGALKDIFPSLHTAGPSFITLFSYRHRHMLPFKFTWPIAAFFNVNIVIATMFLRWHYLIDVVAGLLLSGAAIVIVPRVVGSELARRTRARLTPAWPLFPSRDQGPRSARNAG